MRSTTRPVLAAFLAVLTAVASVAGPAQAARDRALTWKPCIEDKTAQCASLRVPVDRAAPYGPSLTVALARRPATDPKHRIGTLVVNPGGPGGSGVDFALDSPWFFSDQIRRRFDIVGFDPRGVARSNPVKCSAALLAAGPPVHLDSARRYSETIAYNRRLAADCARRTGSVFGYADTLSVVDDMDAVRAALGVETISYYGASYGTLLGAQYAERYPRRVRALVLDSVMDHSGDTGAFLDAETRAAQDSFDEFVAWCARSTACAMHGRDVRAAWAALMDRARRGALRDPFDPSYRMSLHDLLGVAFGSFYDPQWHSLARYLKEASGPAGRRAREPFTDVEYSFPAVFCDDWAMPVRGWDDLRRRLATLARGNPEMPVSPLAMTSVAGCLGWPLPPDNPQRTLATARTGPVLLINARHDPATPHVWAAEVARQLGPKASLVTYEGWGHTVYGRSGCVTGLVDRYLLTVRPPAAGSSCPGVEPKPSGVGKRPSRVSRVVPARPGR
ncbi:alpha/beta hydrolase [Couchioplanes caeruleus]|uniref:Alpha/beta hydrolase n=2 Tax=Couchioplanes caeruleus TaxID=56438 RepID=A0A1K0GBI6_9ACTN|nr:alpha/beta hydrolase [Couchioplanes caeruleus]OJF14602.1 alpha/beta hydrolase [Couchioplanes caeruleus subsp. caeruleus]ROP33138.1 pimeloyl-ACP methyl ester carboxylesterase [Couchioplanes caeruleus]